MPNATARSRAPIEHELLPAGQAETDRCDWRARCYGCHRPMDRCFCNRIPQIDNRTRVLIVQHMRERFHPFNTARIVRRSLLNSSLLVDHNDRLADLLTKTTLLPDAGLLYPGPGSQLMNDLAVDQRPKQLVVLDGTWHHSKTLVRDIPQLQRLPRYRLAPSEPSRYCIRREPDVSFLSTVEATVAALRFLEPETRGFEELLAAFDTMIESQLALPKAEYGSRRNHRRREKFLNIPRSLQSNLENIVVVYGESAPGVELGRAGDDLNQDRPSVAKWRAPIYWVAERLGTGERFESALQPPFALSSTFLKHIELPSAVFEQAPSVDVVRQNWQAFLRPHDTIAFYYSNIPKLLDEITGLCHRRLGHPRLGHPRLHLKSIQLAERPHKTLEQLLAALKVEASPIACAGRPGKRLAATVALAVYLHFYDASDLV